MAAKPTDKNTKAEILSAYERLAEEKKALEAQVKEAQKQATAPAVKTVIATAPTVTNTTPVKDKVNYTIANLESLQLGFGTAVSELSEKLTIEATKLADLRQEVTEEIDALQTLHGLAVTADTFAATIASYQTSAKAFSEELRQRQEACEQEIQTQAKAWTKEIEQYEIATKEATNRDRQTSDREAQEYKYQLDLQRKLDREQYTQQQADLARELAEVMEVQDRLWAERERNIAEREQQFHTAKNKVAAFAQEKEKAIDKAKGEGKGIATYQAKIKSDLYAKDIEGQKRAYEGRIESLEDTIGNQGERIISLSKQLEAALKQVQDLAVKAIEGSANATSYQTLKEITLEQAKSQAKTK